MKFLGFALMIVIFSCQSHGNKSEISNSTDLAGISYQEPDTATFAGGCFWCVEASFEQIEGVIEAVSGYAGGQESSADYRLVSSGRTKHAEAVQVYYDPSVIDYETLLDIFFTAHDPTQLNRQGPDVGPQYRSEIFYHNDEQKRLAEAGVQEVNSKFDMRVVTEISELKGFYVAEEYHQNYEKNHPDNSYIRNVSKPKIDKVAEIFRNRLKKEKLR
ncbi:MAG: peptide-methionine (S)-S-oxide reductase MsrA [Ekhidna sp.]|nr:peptide-methionine (S)-S-oxide reductase MsrA [Ekhidna sp.]